MRAKRHSVHLDHLESSTEAVAGHSSTTDARRGRQSIAHVSQHEVPTRTVRFHMLDDHSDGAGQQQQQQQDQTWDSGGQEDQAWGSGGQEGVLGGSIASTHDVQGAFAHNSIFVSSWQGEAAPKEALGQGQGFGNSNNESNNESNNASNNESNNESNKAEHDDDDDDDDDDGDDDDGDDDPFGVAAVLPSSRPGSADMLGSLPDDQQLLHEGVLRQRLSFPWRTDRFYWARLTSTALHLYRQASHMKGRFNRAAFKEYPHRTVLLHSFSVVVDTSTRHPSFQLLLRDGSQLKMYAMAREARDKWVHALSGLTTGTRVLDPYEPA